MAVELFIEDNPVDLTGDERIAIDYEIFSPESMGNRKGAKSYTFELPKTVRNRALFQNPDGVTGLSDIPYKNLKARAYVNGIDIGISFCRLTSSKSGYTVNLFGGNTGFFDLIRNAKLKDFLFCDLNHRWTLDNVVASRNNTTGYIYPVIDYHDDSPNTFLNNTTRQVYTNRLYPALFYDDILARCIAKLGYTLQNTNPQPDLLLAYAGQPFTRNTNTHYLPVKAETTTDQTAMYNLFNMLSFNYDKLTQNCSYWNTETSISDIQFNFEDGVTIKGTLHWVLNNNTFANINCRLCMGSNILGTPQFEEYITLYPGLNTLHYPFTLSNQMPDENFRPIYFSIHDEAHSSITVKAGSYLQITDVTINESYPVEYNPYDLVTGYVMPNTIFGDVTVAALLKQYCQMFGLILVVNEAFGEVKLLRFDEVRNCTNGYNWSHLLDLTEPPEVMFTDGTFARLNNFTYTKDGDEEKPEGTDGSLPVNDAGLESEKNLVELDFAATQTVERLKGMPLSHIGMLQGSEIKNTRVPRVLRLNRVNTSAFTDTSNLVYTNGTATQSVSTNIPLTYFVGGARNLGFANSLLADNYKTLAEVIDRYKKIKALFRLGPQHINTLDFTRPVYLSYFDAWFYISKVCEYKPGVSESTMVELVKLF